MQLLQSFVEQFTYLGIYLVVLAGSLGLPIPEEMPIIAAGVMSHEGFMSPWPGLLVCVLGVLSGDVVLYWTGRNGGEQVLRSRPVRWLLTPVRECRLKSAYCRHAVKTIVTARHVTGLRAAVFLTAGIARVPFWKFLLTDGLTAMLGVPFSFALAYFFTDHVKAIFVNVHRIERWVGLPRDTRSRYCRIRHGQEARSPRGRGGRRPDRALAPSSDPPLPSCLFASVTWSASGGSR